MGKVQVRAGVLFVLAGWNSQVHKAVTCGDDEFGYEQITNCSMLPDLRRCVGLSCLCRSEGVPDSKINESETDIATRRGTGFAHANKVECGKHLGKCDAGHTTKQNDLNTGTPGRAGSGREKGGKSCPI